MRAAEHRATPTSEEEHTMKWERWYCPNQACARPIARARSTPMTRWPPQSYLLRLWREHPDAPVRSIVVPVGQPDAHQHFADLDALCAFLRAQASEGSGVHDDRDTTCCARSEVS